MNKWPPGPRDLPWYAPVVLIGGTVLLIVIMLWLALGSAHADPYCGDNSYYDYRHDICQAFPVPPPLPVYVDPRYPDNNWPYQP